MRCYPFAAVIAGATALVSVSSFAADIDVESLYGGQCSGCHSVTLRGSAHGAPLSGLAFVEKWGPQSAQALFTYLKQNMPPGQSGKLSDDQHRALAQFIIAENGVKLEGSNLASSSIDINTDSAAEPLETVEFRSADAIDQIARSAGRFQNQVLPDFRPVSQAMLNNPPPGDWLTWRRTSDGHAHSPLDEINRENVAQLQLAWSLTMSAGSNQGTPLIHDGVMFLTHPNNRIQAVEAATGTLLWDYQYDFPPGARMLGGPTRNIAIYGDKVFLATYDAALVAIDATSGEEVWRTVKADYTQAYTHSAGPIIADGIVISGINGCELFTEDGCFITGHDPDTGEELWRTQTLAEPGTEAYESWGDIAPDRRGGGDSWIAGSYDPDLNLFFIGVSQAKPWVAVSRGMSVDDAALYTNSTLAIDPKSGEIVWYFQHIPGETIDMEVGFERVLVDIDGQKMLLTVGKDGILWKLDRKTGEFRALLETAEQTIFESVNPETGALTYRADIANAKIDETFSACPGIYGGQNWQASAFDQGSHLLFLPSHQLCSDMTPRRVDLGAGGGGYGADSVTYPMPGKEDAMGALIAVDVSTMDIKWKAEQPALFLTGALSTEGGLVFVGDLDRGFKAYDAASGEPIWSTRLGAPAHGYPVSYAVDGKQYIAVLSGIGVFRAMTAQLYPEMYQPSGGEAIYVFELPGK
ncbi:pyrrolo-quinoline quinone [Luminiphilus syltensis NOR5-1B]|uniref:Pyrrolo-quinoline quinone n=1 Tax=Luminiphilus syltensis NOR5-1B TaxID=565045 RepID=B8KQF5_9GAMM|nr:PQQ-binding-like beta-propeller repeat protein [Luminiphilus syltensis]EED34472.1 pyrrolo-quinoline quinone [Luminiphilus syltensis NOR5-1B]